MSGVNYFFAPRGCSNCRRTRWQQLASTADFAAHYHHDTNTIYLCSDIRQIALVRGLLVAHEMRHWRQTGHPETTKDFNSRPAKEVDAYQSEFRILDALRLPRMSRAAYV